MKYKLILSFLECKSEPEDSTILDISVIDISEEDIKIIKKIPITASLHRHFYKIEFMDHLQRHLNHLWNNPKALQKQMLNKEKVQRALGVLLSTVKRDFGTSVDGIIVGVESL